MDSKATFGKWDYDAGIGLVHDGDNVVAVVRGSIPDRDEKEQDRRGRLIAAAPDMLAALKHILAVDEAAIKDLADMGIDQIDTSPDSSIGIARAAIAAAEGGAMMGAMIAAKRAEIAGGGK